MGDYYILQHLGSKTTYGGKGALDYVNTPYE